MAISSYQRASLTLEPNSRAVLRGHEGVVGSLLLHQRCVVAVLHKATAVQHVDEISVPSRPCFVFGPGSLSGAVSKGNQ